MFQSEKITDILICLFNVLLVSKQKSNIGGHTSNNILRKRVRYNHEIIT